MSPEETARYHAARPGFELIDFAEVGLPIFKIYVVASLLLHTPLPPIFESFFGASVSKSALAAKSRRVSVYRSVWSIRLFALCTAPKS